MTAAEVFAALSEAETILRARAERARREHVFGDADVDRVLGLVCVVSAALGDAVTRALMSPPTYVEEPRDGT